jgi:hypothetical protein
MRLRWFGALGLAIATTAAVLAATLGSRTRPRPVASSRAPSVCHETVSSGMGAATIADAIALAPGGTAVCLQSGSYPLLHLTGQHHSSYVTVRPVPGGSVTVHGLQIQNSAFLRLQGLSLTEGIDVRDGRGAPPSHDYEFVDDAIRGAAFGIVLRGAAVPIKRVAIDADRFQGIDWQGAKCAPGYAGGQGVTIYYAEGVTITRSTFKEVSWHYIQGGSAGPEGIHVEHDLFEGPIPVDRAACTHLNVWQIWAGGSNDTFSHNIVRGEPGRPAAVTALMFETGPAGRDCSMAMSNTVVSDNLFLYPSSGYSMQILTTDGLVFVQNTVVGARYGTWLDRSETCGAGHDLLAEHNVVVETGSVGAPRRYVIGRCTGTCRFDYNVSDDRTSAQLGSVHYVADWTPAWSTTSWLHPEREGPPSGFFATSGLPFAAGVDGVAGP